MRRIEFSRSHAVRPHLPPLRPVRRLPEKMEGAEERPLLPHGFGIQPRDEQENLGGDTGDAYCAEKCMTRQRRRLLTESRPTAMPLNFSLLFPFIRE